MAFWILPIGLLLAVFIAFSTPAQETNFGIVKILNRPLASVQASMMTYCGDITNHPGFYLASSTNKPGGVFEIGLIDCQFDISGPFNGSVKATSVSSNSTRLEVLVEPRTARIDAVPAARVQKYFTRILEGISATKPPPN